MYEIVQTRDIRGRVRPYRVMPGNHWQPLSGWRRNTVMHDWAAIAAHLLTQGLRAYRISVMYLEFENVSSPGDAVSAPTFSRDEGVSYYQDLAGSGDRDYLRVPMTAARIDSAGDLTDNEMTFFAQSQGTQGVHGKTFSDTVNSKVFGGALVATPDSQDAAQDLVFARFYLDTADQVLKLSTSQIGLEWAVTLQ